MQRQNSCKQKNQTRTSTTLESIEESISAMDSIYDANFGEWIRNETNCKTVAFNIKKYLVMYKSSDFIVVIKWIVKDWTLKSIINLMKHLITDDLYRNIPSCLDELNPYTQIYLKNKQMYEYKLNIVSGIVYTWNTLFIAEFILATSVNFNEEQRAEYFYNVLEVFNRQKLSEILLQIESKLVNETKDKLIERFTKGGEKRKRTGSILDAMFTH